MEFQLPSLELPFFVNLLILLVVARILGEICERFKQPSMIGEIFAGILLGPAVLNFIHHNEELNVISELGIFLLVILAGLEINLSDIVRSLKGKNIIISLLAFFLPLFSGLAIGFYFNLGMMATVFTGLCIAITALPVSIRILMDLGKLNTPFGQKIISVAIFDDILALTILGVLIDLNGSNFTIKNISITIAITILKLLIFLIIIIIAYKLVNKLNNKGNLIEHKLEKLVSILKGKESLFAIFFVFILIFAGITESIGLHFIIGSFFAAMLLSKEVVGKENIEQFEKSTSGIAMGFLAPIFFANIGLEFNLMAINNYSLLVAVLSISFASKLLGGFIGGKIINWSNKMSLALGLGLNARGIMELVIANIAYKANIIDAEIFSILVIMGLTTTLITPILLKKATQAF